MSFGCSGSGVIRAQVGEFRIERFKNFGFKGLGFKRLGFKLRVRVDLNIEQMMAHRSGRTRLDALDKAPIKSGRPLNPKALTLNTKP